VTHWDNHWDKCPGGKTYYPATMLKTGVASNLQDDTDTIFIKISKSNKTVEQAWKGKISEIRKDKKSPEIFFKVHIEREISCPAKYLNYKEGWYIDNDGPGMGTIQQNTFEPYFFSQIDSNSPQEFEDNMFYVLKLIGIHNIHQYNRRDQAGRPDGFFKFENIAVIYDVTLNSNFMQKKKAQIQNYCRQLKDDNEFEFGSKKYTITNCNKYVWIITRSGTSRTIATIDGINVKEVSFTTLKNIYLERLQKAEMTEQGLEQKLREI